jgi:hypothetical protein
VKLGCCACAGGTAACPNDVEPPELLPPPLLLVGDAHGSLGAGVALSVGPGAAVSVGVGVAALALRWSAPADGLRLSSGTGSEEDDAVGDAEPDGEALDCRSQKALVTGSGEADELDGDGLADCSVGAADGLSDGRPEELGPPPSPAKAVAATDANSPAVAAPRATVLWVISSPPSLLPSPEPQSGNRQNS